MKNQEEVPLYNMYCLLLTGNGHEESGRSMYCLLLTGHDHEESGRSTCV